MNKRQDIVYVVGNTYDIGEHQWIAHEQWMESVAKELDCKFKKHNQTSQGLNRTRLQMVGV